MANGHGQHCLSRATPSFTHPRVKSSCGATEDVLGLLPAPLLRMLYAEVANGGFGPGYGITGAGAWGGFSVNGDERYDTIDRCTDTDPKLSYVTLAILATGPNSEPFVVDLPYVHG